MLEASMHIAWLNDAETSFVGEKAATLALLASRNINIPKGFVITNDAFSHFLAVNNIDLAFLENLNLEDQGQVMHAAEDIQRQFQQAVIPEDLQQEISMAYDKMLIHAEIYHQVSAEALNILKTGRDFPRVVIRQSTRSKGTTLLNIKGKEALLQGVKKSLISFFQPETLQRTVQNVEIIVQKMLTVEKSGFASADETVRVEAVLGISDAIASQLAQPDVYVLDEQGTFVDKQIAKQNILLARDSLNGELVKKQIYYQGEGQKLNDYDIRQVVKLYQKIATVLGEKFTLEFAYDSNQLYVLNARKHSKDAQVAVQALQNPQPSAEPEQPETSYTDELHTVTELRAYLDRPEGAVSADGIFTLAHVHEVRQIAQENPSLPVWYSLLHADELSAVVQLHDDGLHNVGIAIAGMTAVEQLRTAKRDLKKAGLEPLEEIEVGAVIDAPALIYVLDDIDREGVDFLVVDFSMLAERSTGVRDDGKNKGYLKLLHQFVKECKLRNIEVGVAGTTFDDELIDFFVKAGFDSILVPKMQLDDVKKKIARAEKRLLLNVARKDLKDI